MPAAIAAAEPPLEPPGERSRFQGFLDAPNGTLSVLPLYPNSGVLVLPTTTAPAALSLATKTESVDAGASST